MVLCRERERSVVLIPFRGVTHGTLPTATPLERASPLQSRAAAEYTTTRITAN